MTNSNNKNQIVSVIIVAEEYNSYLEESLPKYKDLDYPNFEVLVFTTKSCNKKFPKVKFIATPHLAKNPAKRRDLAVKYAKGDWHAFIDDDAYPAKDWLRNASKHFDDSSIAAVCGPGVTPKEAGIFEKASGWASASLLGGGACAHRFLPSKRKFVDDHPSMNLIIKAGIFKKIGGFDSNYYPGEDTKLCSDIADLGEKILYDPKVLVFHHRRPLFKKHLKQNGDFGFHRGYFAKILPQTSRKLIYFVPSLFVLGLLSGPVFYLFSKELLVVWSLAVLIYTFLLIATSVWVYTKEKDVRIALLTAPGIFLTHVWYGIRFIQGLSSRGLSR